MFTGWSYLVVATLAIFAFFEEVSISLAQFQGDQESYERGNDRPNLDNFDSRSEQDSAVEHKNNGYWNYHLDGASRDRAQTAIRHPNTTERYDGEGRNGSLEFRVDRGVRLTGRETGQTIYDNADLARNGTLGSHELLGESTEFRINFHLDDGLALALLESDRNVYNNPELDGYRTLGRAEIDAEATDFSIECQFN